MLFFFLRKFSVSTRFVHVIVISLSGISVESYMLYYPIFRSHLALPPRTDFLIADTSSTRHFLLEMSIYFPLDKFYSYV